MVDPCDALVVGGVTGIRRAIPSDERRRRADGVVPVLVVGRHGRLVWGASSWWTTSLRYRSVRRSNGRLQCSPQICGVVTGEAGSGVDLADQPVAVQHPQGEVPSTTRGRRLVPLQHVLDVEQLPGTRPVVDQPVER
jgi:hypothetical protein